MQNTLSVKRAIGIIFLLFAVVHCICIIWSKLLGIDLKTADPTKMPQSMWYVAQGATFVFSIFGAMWFFRSKEIIPNTKNGFLFGLSIVVIGFTASTLLLLPHENGWSILQKYFSQANYWMAFGLILIGCTFVGYIKGKNE